MFPDQNIAASKVSGQRDVCYVWVYSEGTPYEQAYVRTSADGGANWTDPAELLPPPAYGTDTTASYYITSLFPWYDPDNKLHIVAQLNPIVRDTSYILPIELWHYCPDNTPQWSEIHRAGCDPMNLQAAVGYNAMYACRPSIGGDASGNLFVAWEQFDSANVEQTTNLLRGDVWAAASTDGGLTWLPGRQLTDAATTVSHRFPMIPVQAVVIGGAEYLPVLYEIDQIAGFVVQGQGPSTSNPLCVQWVPVESLGIGVAEPPRTVPARAELSATPNPFSSRTTISYGVPRQGGVSLVLYDASGRPARTLAEGVRDAGRYAVTLEGSGLAGGVYFYKLVAEGASVTKKLTLAR
jgi:hypothetical protein